MILEERGKKEERERKRDNIRKWRGRDKLRNKF